jgi:hypothetical protein
MLVLRLPELGSGLQPDCDFLVLRTALLFPKRIV